MIRKIIFAFSTSFILFFLGQTLSAETTGPKAIQNIVNAPLPQTELTDIELKSDKIRLLAASSTLPPDKSANYEVSNLLDDNEGTAWVEGDAAAGMGEKLIFVMDPDAKFNFFGIRNGYCGTADLWQKNGRVKSLAVELVYESGRIERKKFSLDDSREEQFFLFDELDNIKISRLDPIAVVTLAIAETYKGSRYNDTCLSALVPGYLYYVPRTIE